MITDGRSSDLPPELQQLPASRRLRVHALATLQRYLSPHRGRVGQARDNLPRVLSVPLRRALAPLRITPLSFEADVPMDAHFEPSATQRLRRSVSILVPVYGNPALTLRCLRSVVAHTPSEAEIVVVDDASPDDTYEKLAPFASAHGVILERSARNVGFPATVNTAARQARGELLLILNSDVVVTPGWLTGLCDALEREPSVGLVGPLGNDTGDVATFPASYHSAEELDHLVRTLQSRGTRRVEKLSLFCALIERRVFEQVGGIDESYGRGMFEDDDLCMALRGRGLATLLCENVFVHHSAGSSFRRLSALEYLTRFEVNRRRFESKWKVRWRAHAT